MDKMDKTLPQNSEPYKAFKEALMPGERILWQGSTAKEAKLSDKGTSAAKPFICFGMALMLIMMLVPAMKYGGPIVTLFMLVMIPMFVCIGVAILKGLKLDYAVTNMRILEYDGSGVRSESIEWIADVKYQANEKNIGSVTFSCAYPDRDQPKPGGIFGIEDPEEVCRILIEATEKLRAEESKGENANG